MPEGCAGVSGRRGRRRHRRCHDGARRAQSAAFRRHRHHQYVRRYPVRSDGRIVRQSRAGGLAQRRNRSWDGAGSPRLGTGYRRQEHRQSAVADLVGRDAARLVWPPQQGQGVRGSRRRHREGGRSRDRGKESTADIGGRLGTRETGEAVAARLRA